MIGLVKLFVRAFQEERARQKGQKGAPSDYERAIEDAAQAVEDMRDLTFDEGGFSEIGDQNANNAAKVVRALLKSPRGCGHVPRPGVCGQCVLERRGL